MFEHATTRLVEQERPQSPVARDKARLFPQRVTGRRQYTADNHIPHFALGVTLDKFDGGFATHGRMTFVGFQRYDSKEFFATKGKSEGGVYGFEISPLDMRCNF